MRCLSLVGAVLVCFATGMVWGDVLVDLNPAEAVYDGGRVSTSGGGVPQLNLALGHTFNLEFVPAPDDRAALPGRSAKC